MMLLDEAYVAAVRLMARKPADHDVVKVYQAACGQGTIVELSDEPMQSRGLDF